MEKYTMFMDRKNQCSENEYTTQSNLQIQCNPYQATSHIFHRTRTNNFKICMEIQKTSNSQSNLVKEIVFTPLYILASFVKDKVSTGVWIYLWAFYFVPLVYISVFVPVPYCLDDCGFVVEPEVRLMVCQFYLSFQRTSFWLC